MSREIEFRAWDKVNKKMYKENECITLQHKEGGCTYPNIYIHGELPLIYCFGRSIEIMQFTGLLDCKGVKIYDGDIVQSYHFTDENRKDHFLSHIVKWSDKFSGWFMLNGKDLSGNDGSIQMWVYMKSSKYTAKVIGNIHQNSELLK